MLSKEICKKCINEFYPSGWSEEADEFRWGGGMVWCPRQPLGVVKFEEAYWGCDKYKFEHTVMGQEEKEKEDD